MDERSNRRLLLLIAGLVLVFVAVSILTLKQFAGLHDSHVNLVRQDVRDAGRGDDVPLPDYDAVEAVDGDTFLLSSDGFWDQFSPRELALRLKEFQLEQASLDALWERFPEESRREVRRLYARLMAEAVRGEKGSRYYDMTTRQSRCVTITYSDDMHIDLSPSVLLTPPPGLEKNNKVLRWVYSVPATPVQR